MSRCAALLICIVLLCYPGYSQSDILSPRIANYDIRTSLDINSKKLYSQQRLVWHNRSPDTLRDMYFHLYYNAFRNSESTFFKERGVPEFLSKDIDEICGWGWSTIQSIRDEYGNQLVETLSYVQPDDDNEDDRTVARIELDKPVMPGDSVVLEIEWEAKIPRTMPRTGYNRDFYFFAQWFPKVGVYEPAGTRYSQAGGWNCHQYHSSGEYYADFGNYDVRMTVPDNMVVASSGSLIDTVRQDDRITWHFRAHDVIDFTWAASPDFTMVRDTFAGVELKFYAYPYKRHLAGRYLETLKFGMAWLEEHLGPYPYKTLTVIDAPLHGMFTGGMEYPTLITSISFCFFPEGLRTPETLVIHEYIHQYFMQMVATHEVEDPWMDEGITTYYEGRILDDYFGADRSIIDVLGIRAGNAEYNRIEFFASDNKQNRPNTSRSWEFTEGGYGEISYNKTAVWLKTLEGLIGQAAMDTVMRRYFNTWKFRHPDRYDFTTIVNEYVLSHLEDQFPEGMDWFFEQVLYGTALCDYAVSDIRVKESLPDRGFLHSLDSCERVDLSQKIIISEVTVRRLDEMVMPQEILLVYEDGQEELVFWDGISRIHTIQRHSDTAVSGVFLDPARKIWIDSNFLNNQLSTERHSGILRKLKAGLISAMQHILETVSIII